MPHDAFFVNTPLGASRIKWVEFATGFTDMVLFQIPKQSHYSFIMLYKNSKISKIMLNKDLYDITLNPSVGVH